MGPLYYKRLKSQRTICKDVNYIVRDGEAVIVDEFTPGYAREGAGVMVTPSNRSQRVPGHTT